MKRSKLLWALVAINTSLMVALACRFGLENTARANPQPIPPQVIQQQIVQPQGMQPQPMPAQAHRLGFAPKR